MSEPAESDVVATTELVARFAPNRPEPATLARDRDLVRGAAVGLPNENTQAEELVVVVETRTEPAPDGLAEAVLAAVRAEVGVVPGRVLLVPARTIPLTANGKLRHAVLREQLLASASTLVG